MCLRQLCAPLSCSNKGSNCALPAASADPAARAVAVRAVGCAADAWIKRRSSLNEAVLQKNGQKTHLGRLAREGEAALAALAAEAVRAREDAADRRRSSSSSLEDGERVAAAHGAVVAEAAEAAAWMHAALVSCGACQRGAAAAQVRFCEPELFRAVGAGVESSKGNDHARVDDERYSAGCWRSRLFAQRALAALLAPGPPHLATTCATRGADETLGDALALWALGAGSDARAGSGCALASALFSHPAAMELAEGAPPSGPGAARVLRLRRAIGDAAGGLWEGDDHPTRRALRGATGAGFDLLNPAGSQLDAFFRSAPGSLASREEGEFRVSAGALVSRQMRAYGVGAWGCAMACAARLPRAARVSHDELDVTVGGFAATNGGVGADLRAARHALASCAAGTVRWLVDLIARLPVGEVPGSIPRGVERIVAEEPVLAATAPHPCPARSPAWGGWTVTTVTNVTTAAAASDSLGARVAALLHRDGGPAGVDVRRRLSPPPPSASPSSPTPPSTTPRRGSPASAVVTPSGTRDFRRRHRGTHRGGPRRRRRRRRRASRRGARRAGRPSAGAQFFASELLPRFLARELRGTSQRRCARIWLTAIALLERLAREPDPDHDPDRGGVSPLGVCPVLNDVLPAAAAAMLELVVSSCGDGLDHQATAAARGAVRVRGREARRGGGPGRRDWSRRRDPGSGSVGSRVGGSRGRGRRRIETKEEAADDGYFGAGGATEAGGGGDGGWILPVSGAAAAAASYFRSREHPRLTRRRSRRKTTRTTRTTRTMRTLKTMRTK